MSALVRQASQPVADGWGDLDRLCRHPDPVVRWHAQHALKAAQTISMTAAACGIDIDSPPDEAAIDRLLREAGR